MSEPQVGDLRVWYIPQVPGKPFYVDVRKADSLYEGMTLKQRFRHAENLQRALCELSYFEFDNRVKPDYADAAGIERFEEDGEGGFDWYEFEEEQLEYEDD